jgi:hypothetical protein
MKLIGQLEVKDPHGNVKTLSISVDREDGWVGYQLKGSSSNFAISNLQCGWRGPKLPDNTYEYPTNTELISAVKQAVNGGTYTVTLEKIFVK